MSAEHMAPNHEAQYHPSTRVRPPRESRDEGVHLPQIASAQGAGEKKRAAARARGRPGEGPAIAWVESALEDSRRFGKPLEKPATDQVFASEVRTMHAGLQRAGVEVATFLDETGATNWATAQSHRVVCACLQLDSRDVLKDPDAVVRMIARYTSRGLSVLVVQPTPPVPTAKDAKCVRVGKRICGDTHVPLCLDTRSTMQCVMELVAKGYAFVDGRLQRVAAAAPKQEEVSAPSPVNSGRGSEARRSPTRLRPTPPPADPLPPSKAGGAAAGLGIGIIQPLEPEPEVAPVPRAGRFLRPKKKAARQHAAAAAAQEDAEAQQFDFDPKYGLAEPSGDYAAGDAGGYGGGLDLDSSYCSRCELLEQKLDLVQADPGSQRAVRMEAEMQALQQSKDDQEQVLKARIATLEKQAVTGSRKQEIGVLEQQIAQAKTLAEAKETQLVEAAKADKAKALRQQKFKMARYLTELAEHKTLVEDLKAEIAALKQKISKQKKQGNVAVMNKDEEAVNLAMQLADAEEAKGQAEGKLAGLQAALVVEKGTVAALRTKVPAAFESRKAAGVAVDMFSADEYIEAVEGMDKGELKEALLQGVVPGDDAVTAADLKQRLKHMEIDEMRSLLRQSFILTKAGMQRPPLPDESGGGGGDKKEEETSSINVALCKVREQKMADAAAAKRARLIAVEKAKAAKAAADAAATEDDGGDDDGDQPTAPGKMVSLGAALASKSGASRWLAQAKAAALARKLMAEGLEKERAKAAKDDLDTEDGGDAPTAADRLGMFTAGDHFRGVVNSRAIKASTAFTAKITQQTKAEALRLKANAEEESEEENFAAAVASLDAALTLWPEHPLNGNPEIKEAKVLAEQHLKGQKLRDEADKLAASGEFASARDVYTKAAELWPENAAIPEAKQTAENKLAAQQLAATARQALAEVDGSDGSDDGGGRSDGLRRGVEAYREALSLDPDSTPYEDALSQAEQRLKATELKQQGAEKMERSEFAEAVKSFSAAALLDEGLAPSMQAPKEECERKLSALEKASQADLHMEHGQFEPAISGYTEAIELWGGGSDSAAPDSSSSNPGFQAKLASAEEKKAQFDQEKAAAEAMAAAQALLAKLDALRETAETQLTERDFAACISSCGGALSLDQEADYVSRGVLVAMKEEAEHKKQAEELAAYAKEQLAANDFRAVDTLTEALTLDPDSADIMSMREEAVRKKEAREKQILELKAKAQQRATAEAARKKVKKAAAGTSWLAAAQHQAADLAAHLAGVEEEEKAAELSPAAAAAAAAATEAASLGPAAVGAARAAARTAIEEGVSEEGAAAAGAAAAAIVGAGLGKAAEEAGRKAADKYKEDATSEEEKEAQKKKYTNLLMKSSMYKSQITMLETALRESEEEAASAVQFVQAATDNLTECRAELQRKELAWVEERMAVEEKAEETTLEYEMLQEEVDAYRSKEKMMMLILRKAGLASALDSDGDGSVSKEEAEAFLGGTDEEEEEH